MPNAAHPDAASAPSDRWMSKRLAKNDSCRLNDAAATFPAGLPQVAAKYAKIFPKLELVTVDGVFGGWAKAQAAHFADGGVF